nr:ATP-binding protein [Methylacidimicrobium sp. AP8]
MAPNAAQLFFPLVSRRYERGSQRITGNRNVGEWGRVFGDAVVAAAILDRLFRHSQLITIRGESYRLKENRRAGVLLQPFQHLCRNRSETRIGVNSPCRSGDPFRMSLRRRYRKHSRLLQERRRKPGRTAMPCVHQPSRRDLPEDLDAAAFSSGKEKRRGVAAENVEVRRIFAALVAAVSEP